MQFSQGSHTQFLKLSQVVQCTLAASSQSVPLVAGSRADPLVAGSRVVPLAVDIAADWGQAIHTLLPIKA